MRGSHWKRHALATAVMLAGSLGIGGFVLAMNAHVRPPEKEAGTQATEFVVEKLQKKREQPPPPKKKKPRRTPHKAPPVGLPDLGASMALSGLPMPDVDVSGLLDATGSRPDPGSMVMTEDAVDSLPRPRRLAEPIYPERARQLGIEGQVTARLLIDAGGSVRRVRLEQASPEGMFEEVALAALNRWTFEPATYEGQPVDVWARQTVEFRLD